MKFEVGKYYKHTTGEKIHILQEIKTYAYGECLLAENDKGGLIPVGKEEWNTINFIEITSKEFYPRNEKYKEIEEFFSDNMTKSVYEKAQKGETNE